MRQRAGRFGRALALFGLCLVGTWACAPREPVTAHLVAPTRSDAGGAALGAGLGRHDDPGYLFSQRGPSDPARGLTVLALAYTSKGRTSKKKANPRGAWGDELTGGSRAVAVSPDLLDKGLGRGAKLRIDGLDGEYVVLDIMHGRWKNTIDIYFGDDHRAASRWGRRTMTIYRD